MEIKPQSLRDRMRFTILDLGSDKLKCAIFRLNNAAEPEVIGSAEVSTVGIKGGTVVNIERAKRSIIEVLESTEKVADESIEEVCIITSDVSITGKQCGEKLEVSDKKISEADVELLRKKIAEKVNTPVIHMAQQECFIDGVQGVSNPVGMYGRSLSASFYVISGVRTMMLNLENLISQCNLKFVGCAFAPYVSGYSVLSEDEREVGALVIDMGAISTTAAIFRDGKVCHIASVPVGGLHVSKDIAFGLNIGVSSSEMLKKDSSSFLLDRNSENHRVDLSIFSDVSNQKDVSAREITDMVVPRLEETFELLNEKVRDNNFSTVVLTGGGSKIANIRRIAEKIFLKKVRTQGGIRVNDVFYGPEYSGIFGLAAIMSDLSKETLERKSLSYIRKILNVVSLRAG